MSPSGILFSLRASVAGLALYLCAAAPASAQTPVHFGDVISEPGVYFLAGNQTGAGTGITILSGDVTLLLLRFTLRGDGNFNGINCIANDNVTIVGGRITSFLNGIAIALGRNVTVKDTRLDHCRLNGLSALSAFDSAFLRLRADHNGANGVVSLNCLGSRYLSVLSSYNGENGFLLANPEGFAAGTPVETGTKLRLCWAAYNGLDGIRVVNTQNHEIVQNQCVDNSGAGIRLTRISLVPGVSEGPGVGSRDNLIKSNWCVFNHDGVFLDDGSAGNTLTNNTALANFGHDLVDERDEPPCENTWFLNVFLTKDGAGEDCIF